MATQLPSTAISQGQLQRADRRCPPEAVGFEKPTHFGGWFAGEENLHPVVFDIIGNYDTVDLFAGRFFFRKLFQFFEALLHAPDVGAVVTELVAGKPDMTAALL